MMAEAQVPVDLFNPGQVFACLGFMEAAEILLGDAEGGFDWSDEAKVKFILRASGERNPFEVVLEFLAEAEPKRWGPLGYADPPPKKGKKADVDEADDDEEVSVEEEGGPSIPLLDLSETFCTKEGDRMALPIRFGGGNRPLIEVGHWADGSSRESFKLYAGNRSAEKIATAMLRGVRAKPTKKQRESGQPGDFKFKGLVQLWEDDAESLTQCPFQTLTAMGGSFNFDPRGAWTAIDAGYSPNEHKHPVNASPIVEFLAAWGFENARPDEFATRQVRYAAWGAPLPPILARAALTGGVTAMPLRRFRFGLDMSGKNKVVTFAQEEIAP